MEKLHPKISVVVPVYKVEKFVAECLESILSQDFDALEVVAVDDGSPDNSGKICDDFAMRDSRVRVFHKENGGVSSARKLGTECSRSEWICFVDGDDALPPHALAPLFSGTQKFPEADIVEGSSTEFREGADLNWAPVSAGKICRRDPFTVSGFDYAKEVASRRGMFSLAPWRKLIRRDVLVKTGALNVPRKITPGQDTMMNIRMATGTRLAVKIPDAVYSYRRNELSTTGSKKNINRREPAEYHLEWWRFAKSLFADQNEEWQIVWKTYVCATLPSMFVHSRGRFLKHAEVRKFIPSIVDVLHSGPRVAYERTVRVVMLGTVFPFSLIPECLYRSFLRFAYKFMKSLRNRGN